MNASLPEHLHNSKGYLLLSKLDVSAMESEQYNLFTAVTDDGRFLSQEECEKLFLNGGSEREICPVPDAMIDKLHTNQEQHSKAKLKDIDSRNLIYFKQEEERIIKWEHDMLDDLEEQIKVLRKSIQTAERDSRNATNVEEKLKAERKVDELKRKRRRLRNELDDREDEIGDKRELMISEIEEKMIQNVNNEDIFLIRWQIN